MKIVELRASNVKRLRAVEIRPDGNLVVVSGRNAQGKSSVLDAIWMALGGGDASKDTKRPIRDGEKRAEVSLDLGDLIVTRRWTADDKTSLKVETKEGLQYKSPQAVLDALVGRLSFDPLAFAEQREADQLATLLSLVDLPIDPKALDAERATFYAERTEIGRELKKLEGQLSGMPAPAEDAPTEEVSAAAVLADYQAAEALTRANDEKRRALQAVKDRIGELQEAIAEFHRRIAKVETMLQEAIAEHGAAKTECASLQDPDLGDIRDRLSSVEATNATVRAAKARAEKAREVANARSEVESLTGHIEAIDEAKSKAMREAHMPLDGLGFDTNGVTYLGLPLKQASDAEQLRVSVAMAMALNPKLRVIRIREGSRLDSDGMALLAAMADAQDVQIWVEKVSDGEPVGVVIEDGAVASVNGARVEPAEATAVGNDD